MADEHGAAVAAAGEEIATDQTTVACDGGGGALGHPRVFLHMEDGRVECPYCGRQYVLTGGAGSAQEPAH
ncbi:MAG: zinc-finger domain-containing protein [Alphaproteobacteria bacterium]|nr:zinc-finger domain-containing protein [Alphaproteobacteria bacterium]